MQGWLGGGCKGKGQVTEAMMCGGSLSFFRGGGGFVEGFVEASQEEREASIHPVERVDVHTERGSRPLLFLYILP